MTKRILIDSTHAEETRVVLLDGSKVEDFDVETASKRQLKGNIYLAKVVRVEPSLQAAFVEYGGGRHGFLAFGEIHPDYYQIPIADREKLLALQAQAAREEDEDAEPLAMRRPERISAGRMAAEVDEEARDEEARGEEAGGGDAGGKDAAGDTGVGVGGGGADARADSDAADAEGAPAMPQPTDDADAREARRDDGEAFADAAPNEARDQAREEARVRGAGADMADEGADEGAGDGPDENGPDENGNGHGNGPDENGNGHGNGNGNGGYDAGEEQAIEAAAPEVLGGAGDTFEGNGADEARVRARRAASFLRNYRIQEVIRRRQVLLVQVVKEERGNKGAALTTYISLAGRFCVLMPNSPRGGGISRKITSAADRRRLKEITTELQIPDGMGLIVRTAGANRPRPEIVRDCEYLMRLWDDIRELTLRSVAPALIYEEANLIKRTIRDLYSRDIEDVEVDGEAGWKAAHEFMRMLMPSHAKKVVLWQGTTPLFAHHHVEAQLDAMLMPAVPLRSGGSLVINQAEALVAIDVNSGRATRERGIEETALKTNLEAADEVARQLRLRDLAGLIVIDFIDMENRRNNTAVERRLKEALKNDRARIQVGSISHFGLLEMSRQRLRPSLAESSFIACPHCGGTGHVRGTESSAIHVLRAIEEEAAKGRASAVTVHVAPDIALYLLNHKRARLAEIELRTAIVVTFAADPALVGPAVRIERVRARAEGAPLPVAAQPPRDMLPEAAAAAFVEDGAGSAEDAPGDAATDAPREAARGGPRRGPRDAGRDAGRETPRETAREAGSVAARDADEGGETAESAADAENGEGDRRRRRRRRRRGGRREDGEAPTVGAEAQPDLVAGDGERGDGERSDGDGEESPAGEATRAAGLDPAQNEQPEIGVPPEEGGPRARRRGRRGGRRRRRDGPLLPGTAEDEGGEAAEVADDEAPASAAPAPAYKPAPSVKPAYVGPTPADPFAGQALDIFDLMELAEEAQLAQPMPPAPPPARPRAGEVTQGQAADAVTERTPPAVAGAPMQGEVEAAAPAEPSGIEVPKPMPAPTPIPAPEPAAAAPAAKPQAVEVAEPAPSVVPPPVDVDAAPVDSEARKRGWWRR